MADTPKRGEDFALKAAERQIGRWDITDCSICGYDCGYVFADGIVGYDAGCYCTGRYRVEPRTWDDVAHQYNINREYPAAIAKYDAFWGFDSPSSAPPEPSA